MIGQTLHNRYTLTAPIGKGAMGTVYRATDSQAGDEVAVKVLNRELAFSPELLERFRREGEALRHLRHPNIVGLVDAFQHDPDLSGGAGGQQVIVMEYVAGGSLHSLIKQGPLPADHARKIALGLCDALTRAHDLNIIHRDIKPENILVAADGTPKLTDFGIARLLTEGTRITHSGVQVGTPYYMSPEAWEGKPLDPQADVWSLGIVLFEMLAGEVPFPGDTVIGVMHKVLTAPLPELKQTRPDAPDGLAQIVRRMMTRDRAERYPSMRQVAADLERGEPMAVPVQPLTQPARRIPAWVWVVGGLATVGIVTGAIIFGTGTVREKPTATAEVVVEVSATATSEVVIEDGTTLTETPVSLESPNTTAVPLLISPQGPYFYDNFESDVGSNGYDSTRWTTRQVRGEFTLGQENGYLRVSGSGEEPWAGVEFYPMQYLAFPLEKIGALEAKLMLASDHSGGGAGTQIKVFTTAGGDYRAAMCGNETDEFENPRAICQVEERQGEYSIVGKRGIAYDQWHTFRIEVDADKPEFFFFVDGELLGSLIPLDDVWRAPDTRFGITIWSGRNASTFGTGYIDDVFISDTRSAVPSTSAPTPTPTLSAQATATSTPAETASATATSATTGGITGSISGTLSITRQCADGSVHTIFVNAIPVASGPPGYMTRLAAPGSYAPSDLPPGGYNMGAVMDCNEGPSPSGDVSGMYGRTVQVTAGRETSGVDFALSSLSP